MAHSGLTARQINEALGVKSNGGGMWSIWTGRNICGQLPSREQWERLSKLLGISEPYDRIVQTWNPQPGLGNVWSDIDFRVKGRIHPTQKPAKLVRRLVEASSNPGDLVLDPFMGSGTTGAVCAETGRRFVGVERDHGYFAGAAERIRAASGEG